MQCEMDRLSGFPAEAGSRRIDDRGQLTNRYAYACPDFELITHLASHPVVELGAGSGYWARLVDDSGGQIAALDNASWNSATEGLWFSVQTGYETRLTEFEDRTLLLVMPARPGDADRFVRQWRGERLVVVARGGFPFVDDIYHETAISDGRWELIEERSMPEAVGTMVATSWHR
jgi:hypothetical protein